MMVLLPWAPSHQQIRVFIAYSTTQRFFVQGLIEWMRGADLEAEAYDPDKPWKDPVSEVAALIQSADVLVAVEDPARASSWVRAELAFAMRVGLPSLMCSTDTDMGELIERCRHCSRRSPQEEEEERRLFIPWWGVLVPSLVGGASGACVILAGHPWIVMFCALLVSIFALMAAKFVWEVDRIEGPEFWATYPSARANADRIREAFLELQELEQSTLYHDQARRGQATTEDMTAFQAGLMMALLGLVALAMTAVALSAGLASR